MDIKRFLSSMLMAAALMLVVMWWMGDRGKTTAVTPVTIYTPILVPQASQGGAVEETRKVGDADDVNSKEKMAVTVNNRTAGIDLVQLNKRDFAQTTKRDKPLTLMEAKPFLPKPFSTLGIHVTRGAATRELQNGWVREAVPRMSKSTDSDAVVAGANGSNILDSQYIWKVEPSDPAKPNTIVMSMTMRDAGVDVASIRKIFELVPKTYELKITHQVENLVNENIKVQIDQFGPSDLSRDDPQRDERYYFSTKLNSSRKALFDLKDQFSTRHDELTKLAGGTKLIGQMHDFSADPHLYVSAANRFFTSILRPLPGETPPTMLALADKSEIFEVHHIKEAHLDVVKVSTAKPSETVGMVRLIGMPMSIPPRQNMEASGPTISMPMTVYLGPKDRELLAGDFTAAPGTFKGDASHYQYSYVIRFSQNVCFCYSFWVMDFVVNGILQLLLNMLHFFASTIAFHNFGIAIMILVLLVRAILHPLTRASQISMAKMGKKMREIQPQIEAAKKRHSDPKQKQKQTEEIMRIYRENKVNPAGGVMGCLPMLIQMPIWAALYTGLQSDISLRHEPFIPGWINDLSVPDTVLPPLHRVLGDPLFTVPLVGWEIYGLNLLPILLLAVFYFQMKVTMASQPKPADEQQAQMQKMSQYMIFIFPLFLYSAPSGLNLYIFASTIGGLLDTWLVRKTLKKQGILPQSAENLPTHEQKDEKKKDEKKG